MIRTEVGGLLQDRRRREVSGLRLDHASEIEATLPYRGTASRISKGLRTTPKYVVAGAPSKFLLHEEICDYPRRRPPRRQQIATDEAPIVNTDPSARILALEEAFYG